MSVEVDQQRGKERPLRLLSLDGGGIRGLSELLVLQEVMNRIKGKSQLDYEPRPCDYFDLIGGTSTGGLIALLLGRLKFTVPQATKAYLELAKYVFSERKHFFQEGTFKSSRLKEAIQLQVELCLGENTKNALMIDAQEPHPSCRAFVCAVAAPDYAAPTGPTLFRTYEVVKNKTFNCTIWEAGLATSAAPTFFRLIEIGEPGAKIGYLDAGLGYNNPIELLIDEAQREFGKDRSVACIVSLGTGETDASDYERPDTFEKIVPVKLIKMLEKITTNAGAVAQRYERKFEDVPNTYFRLNVQRSLGQMALDEWQKLGNVALLTTGYLNGAKVSQEVDQLIDVLIGAQADRNYVKIGAVGGPLLQVLPIKWAFPENLPVNRNFVAREELDKAIRTHLSGKSRICILQGMGGLGKTEMARNLAMSRRGRCHVFWIDCRRQHEMIRDFVAIGPMLVPGKDTFDVAAVRTALSQRDDWLMIIDNVDEKEILQYIQEIILSLPYQGQVLVTGRLTMIRGVSPAHTIEMQVMSSAEAVSFLKLLLAQQDLGGADELVKLLDCLPLAIEQAALYMIDNHMSIDMYLDRYQNKETRADLLNYEPESPYSKPVLKTFDISFDKMSADSQLVLQLFAFFGVDSISDEFLQRSAQHHPVGNWKGTTDELEDYDRGILLQEKYRSVLTSPKMRDDACDALVRVALLKRQGRWLSMHPMQKEWLRERSKEDQSDLELAVLAITTNYFASMTDREFILRSGYERYVPVILENLVVSRNAMLDKDDLTAKVCFYLARTVWLAGDDAIAAYLYGRALGHSEKAFGKIHILTAWIQKNLALIYAHNDDKIAAAQFFKKAFENMKILFKQSDHREIINMQMVEAKIKEVTEVQSSWEDFQNLLFRLEGLTFKGACQTILKRSLQRASGNVALSLRLDFPISYPIPTPRVIDCIVCQQSPAELLRSIKHEFILSEITRTDQPLAGLEVHMQAIMRMLLGDIEGAMSLYRRADLTFYKQYGFRSRVPSSRSEDTEMIMLSCRVGEQVFSRLAGRLMRTGTALSGPRDDPNPLLNRLEDSIKPRDSRFEKISYLRRNLIQSLLECEFKDLDIENPIETHETDGHLQIEPPSLRQLALRMGGDQLLYSPLWMDCTWKSVGRELDLVSATAQAVSTALTLVLAILANLSIGRNHAAVGIFWAVKKEIEDSARVNRDRWL